MEKGRLNLVVSQGTRDQLERLRVVSGSDSRSETVRRAVHCYDVLKTHMRKNGKIILRDANGKEMELEIL